MEKDIIKALEIIEFWLGEISKTNDANVSETGNLHIVLLNLLIEDAHIKAKTEINSGIVPIAKQIERVINRIHDNTDNLRNKGRTELRQAFADIKKYILDKENEK